MSIDKENPLQEIPTREFLAKEARDLLFYAAQEGSSSDVEAYYYGLDIEKILAFIETEGEKLNRLPAVIAEVLMGDLRKEVQNALKANPAIFENPHFFSAKNLERVCGLTPEEVVENGRKCVANILHRVTGVGRELREEEVKTIQNMARNIPDPDVIEAILPLAEKHAGISMELVQNSAITSEQINRIINAILHEKEANAEWIYVTLELIAHQYAKLDEAMKKKLANDEEIKPYIDIFKNAKGQNGNGNKRNGKGKKRQTPGQKKATRAERKARRSSLFDGDRLVGQ